MSYDINALILLVAVRLMIIIIVCC